MEPLSERKKRFSDELYICENIAYLRSESEPVSAFWYKWMWLEEARSKKLKKQTVWSLVSAYCDHKLNLKLFQTRAPARGASTSPCPVCQWIEFPALHLV
jgi:hypothetical protein